MSRAEHHDHPLRPDLAAVLDARHAVTDAARPDAVARRHGAGAWTARERIERFVDPGSAFVEYGGLTQPRAAGLWGAADGLVAGHGVVDGNPVCLLSYDYSVMGGSQSPRNHAKIDRMFRLAHDQRWPVVIWSEGGGARPHEVQEPEGARAGTFTSLARLSGWVPTVAVLPGRAFAGHANLAGLVDVAVAVRSATMGMAGPPLVQAATHELLTPEELGPMDVHEEAGAVDLVVDDEAQAAAAARHYLSFFTGRQPAGEEPDRLALRHVVPDNPRRAYDVRRVVNGLADIGSVLELRPRFGRAVVTTLCRMGGHTVGVIANQPMVLAGSLDAAASDKLARFASLCDAYDVPILFLVDTPGFLVGRNAERTALVRHSARTLSTLADLSVPILTVVLRKAYGLGYVAMGSSAFDPVVQVGWPTAEFGGMGLEGAVNIIYARDLADAPDDEARSALRAERTEELRQLNTGMRRARSFSIDDLIDPADTRAVLVATLDALAPAPPRRRRKHRIDPW